MDSGECSELPPLPPPPGRFSVLECLLKHPKRRDREFMDMIFVLARRCPAHVELLPRCRTNRLGVERGCGGHERISSLEIPFAWCCGVVLLKVRGEVDAAAVGLFHLELALVV